MRTATLQNHQDAVRLVEDEFGLEWLEGQLQEPEGHPVGKAWRELREALEEYARSGSSDISERILSLTRFTEDLRVAKTLGNYESAIAPRLKGSEFSKVQYEIEVAAFCVREGFQTEFIVPSDEAKSADLLVDPEGVRVHVECTRRDPYIPVNHQGSGPIKTLLDGVRSQRLAGLEVVVIVLSELEEKDVPSVVRDVVEVERREDSYLLRRRGYGLYVQKLPPPEGDGYWLTLSGLRVEGPGTLESGIFIPAGQNPAWAEATVAADEAGRNFLTGHYRVYVHTIDSHDLQTMIETFGRKRRQIPKYSDSQLR